MNSKNKKIQKFVAILLFVAILSPSFIVFSPPKKAEAQFTDFVNAALTAVNNFFSGAGSTAQVTQTALTIKDVAKAILTQTLKIAARKVLAEMTKSTVEWINTGRGGQPLFLENPNTFFDDLYKTEIKKLSWAVGFDSHRYPFSKDYIIGLMRVYKQDAYYNAQSSLSRVTNDPTLAYNYRTNFSVSGWDGLVGMAQNMQDNALGFPMAASNTLARQIQAQNEKVSDALLHGQGFLPPQICVSNPNYDNDIPAQNRPNFDPSSVQVTGTCTYTGGAVNQGMTYAQCSAGGGSWSGNTSAAIASAKAQWDQTNTCPGGLTNTTPGSVAASEVMKAVNIPQQHAWISSAMGNSLTAVFDALANKLVNKGLRYISKKTNLQPDTFSYQGETFGQPPTDSTTPWYNYPDEVVDVDKFKKEISGKSVVKDANGTLMVEALGNCSGTTVLDNSVTPAKTVVCAAGTLSNGIISGSATVVIAGITTSGTFEYVPGSILLTALELRLIDDTQPSNLTGSSLQTLNVLRPNSNNQSPGLTQIIDRTWPVAFSLDQCIPGPNKGWEERLDEEKDKEINTKLMMETGATGGGAALKIRAANGVMRDLRFAVQSYKDWVTDKMLALGPVGMGLPNSALYIDAVKSLDDNTYQTKQIEDSRRAKISALARLLSIESQLASIISQPAKDSSEEKRLINIRKQFRSVESAISSKVSVENRQGDLDLASEKLTELRGYDASCTQERSTAGWNNPGGMDSVDPSKIGGTYVEYKVGTGSNTGSTIHTGLFSPIFGSVTVGVGTSKFVTPFVFPKTGREIELFCLIPIVSGYSHGEAIRADEAMRIINTGSTASNGPAEAPAGWFTFRNMGNDAGAPGYEDLPLVKAQNVYGDQTGSKDIVDIDINCKYIYETKIQDYEHAGDAEF